MTLALFELKKIYISLKKKMFLVLHLRSYDKDVIFACMHLTDAFFQSDLHCIEGVHFIS